MKISNPLKSFSVLFFVILGILWVFMEQGIANETPTPFDSSNRSMKPGQKDTLVLAHRECQKENETHCRGVGRMGCGRGGQGHRGGMGCERGGMGRHEGMRHGMRHGMGRGPGVAGEAQCPQSRSTAIAPELLYNKTNPLENTLGNIEKGRLLFELDAQPSCTACHGSGDGLGMMSGGLNPPPRNFTCKETMENISDGQLFWIIQNGSSGTAMPAFSNLNNEQIWQLVLFLRTLAN